MKIIISPAKKMNIDTDTFLYRNLPVFLDRTREIMSYMKTLSYADAKKLWGCNDSIAELNYDRFKEMNLEQCLTPAIMSYEGIQYQYMAPIVLSDSALNYLENQKDTKSSIIAFRVTPEERAWIEKQSYGNYRRISDFVRDCVFEKDIVIVKGLDEFSLELRRIGNNLNQLTRAVNAGIVRAVAFTLRQGQGDHLFGVGGPVDEEVQVALDGFDLAQIVGGDGAGERVGDHHRALAQRLGKLEAGEGIIAHFLLRRNFKKIADFFTAGKTFHARSTAFDCLGNDLGQTLFGVHLRCSLRMR